MIMNPQLAQALGDFGTQITQLQSTVDRLSRNQKTNSLSNGAIDNGSVVVTDSVGQVRQVIGIQADGTATTVDMNGPQPGPLDTPTVSPVIQGLTVTWDGEFAGSAVYPSDYMMTQVHISTVPGFSPVAGTLAGVLHSAGSYTILNLTAGTTYYVVLAALSTSGVLGELSGYASGVPALNVPYISPGFITTTDIAPGAVTTPILAANAVTAVNVAANAITAGTVAAGAIDGMTITGNVINGAVINAGELTFSDSAGGGIFGYTSGVLTAAWTGAQGMDAFGYSYPAGFSMGAPGVPQVLLSQNVNGAYLALPTNTTIEHIAAQMNSEIIAAGATYEQLMLFIASPANNASTAGNQWNISMSSDSSDSSIPAQFLVTDSFGVPYISLTNPSGTGALPQFAIGYAGSSSAPVTVFLNGSMVTYGTSSGGVQIALFNTPGTHTWICPAGVTSIKVENWGGGGGGGGGSAPTTSGGGGCGGGSGEYAAEYTLAVTPGNSYSIIVGAGGAGGAAGTPTGAPGGNGSIGGGTYFPGDSVGVYANEGGGGTGGHNGIVGGYAGSGSTNTHHNNGNVGAFASPTGTATGGAGGGSSGCASAAGNFGNNATSRTPGGGAASSGSGSAPGGGGGWGSNSDNGSVGSAGSTGGGGGGGGGGGTDAHTWGGGHGGSGTVKITYTQPGSTQILASLANAAGTDDSGNAYPAGFQGQIVAVRPGSTPSVPETWHTIALASGWTGAVGTSALYYRLTPMNTVQVFASATHSAFNTSTALTAALPSAYWPINTRNIGAPGIPGRAGASISATGTITAQPNGTSCGEVDIMGEYPLGI
jgi:hypothetical protein